MKQEIKSFWLEDLRSGKYIQGEGHLQLVNVDDGFVENCCLGVLLDGGAKRGFWSFDWNTKTLTVDDDFAFEMNFGDEDYDDIQYVSSIEIDDEQLPQPLLDWLGIQAQEPLIHKNDGFSMPGQDEYVERENFLQIADYIEEHE